MSLASTGFELVTNRTRKREFLDEMNFVFQWSELLSLIAPHAPTSKTGRPPFVTEVMLRIHLLQQYFGHSDPAMEEALHDIPWYHEFAHLDAGMTRLPDESTIWASPQKQSQLSPNGCKSAMNPELVSPYEHSRIKSRIGGGYADHP